MKSFIKSSVVSFPDRLPVLLAFAALAFVGTLAQAADLPEVTISAPSVKTVDRDAATGAPIQEITETARVSVDPVTLTTNSGVALLQDKVLETAQQICDSTDPLADEGDGSCVREAVKSAQAQVKAAVARANSDNGHVQSPARSG
jgi:UrcA family protein